MMYVFFALVPLLLAAAFRLRGSHHRGMGTTATRVLFWAIPIDIVCSATAYVCDWSLWFGTICGVLAWAGACIGHGSAMGDTLEDYEEMGFITSLRLSMIALPFILFGVLYQNYNIAFLAFILPMFGIFGGVGYWVGYRMKRELHIKWLGVHCVVGDTSWGELFTGALAFGFPLQILGFVALMGRGV